MLSQAKQMHEFCISGCLKKPSQTRVVMLQESRSRWVTGKSKGISRLEPFPVDCTDSEYRGLSEAWMLGVDLGL